MKFPVEHSRILANDDWGRAYNDLLLFAKEISLDTGTEEFRTLGDIWEEGGSPEIDIRSTTKAGHKLSETRPYYQRKTGWRPSKLTIFDDVPYEDAAAELGHAIQYTMQDADSLSYQGHIQEEEYGDMARYFLGPDDVDKEYMTQAWNKGLEPGTQKYNKRRKELVKARQHFQIQQEGDETWKIRSVENEAHYKNEPWINERLDEARERDVMKANVQSLIPELSNLPAHSEERRKRFTKTTPLETYREDPDDLVEGEIALRMGPNGILEPYRVGGNK